jgi:hypothetical protein
MTNKIGKSKECGNITRRKITSEDFLRKISETQEGLEILAGGTCFCIQLILEN